MNISIIITYYNKGKLLIPALESVLSEILKQDEIIVVDDCSSDIESRMTLSEVMKRFAGVEFCQTTTNSGASFAKNMGITRAKNEIIMLLDADDTLPRGAISRVRSSFEFAPDTDVFFGDYRTVNDEGMETIVDCSVVSTTTGLLDIKKLAKKWILLGSSPFNRESYFKYGGYDQLYPRTDDVDFFRRMLVKGATFRYVDSVIYNWNTGTTENSKKISYHEALFSAVRSLEFYFRQLSPLSFLFFLSKLIVKMLLLKIRVSLKHP